MYIVDKTELIYDLLIYNSVFDTKKPVALSSPIATGFLLCHRQK